MNRAILNQYIEALVPMPTDKVRRVAEGFEAIEMPKNEFLIRENKVSKETYFLESGIIRSFIFDNNGEEVTINIFSAPCFVNDFLSFFRQEPAKETFQTLTICKIWKMDYSSVQVHFHTYPEFREFGRMMLVTNYAVLQNRMLGMIKDTAETRYLTLMQEQPDIFQNVSLKIIASYLGITDTSLSRIRREISQK
jgi:CRP-like cAMP-binding protein